LASFEVSFPSGSAGLNHNVVPMISLDYSVFVAILIFLSLVYVLNRILFRPLMRVRDERDKRTTGLVAEANKQLEHHSELFDKYQATIKNARMEGYQVQERTRSEALAKRNEALSEAKQRAEQLSLESRESIRTQLQSAKEQLGREADEMARSIAASILK